MRSDRAVEHRVGVAGVLGAPLDVDRGSHVEWGPPWLRSRAVGLRVLRGPDPELAEGPAGGVGLPADHHRAADLTASDPGGQLGRERDRGLATPRGEDGVDVGETSLGGDQRGRVAIGERSTHHPDQIDTGVEAVGAGIAAG